MQPSRLLPLLLVLLKLITGFGLASRTYELHRDEYLYLNYGQHLAWGYLEVPPLTALQSWLTLTLGGGWFWVKFWPILWGSLTVYLVGRTAQRLGGGSWAVLLAGICYLVGAFARLNFLFQPNSFEVFAFTLACYLLICYQQQAQSCYLYGLGAVLGLALLNKYSALFFIAALVAGVLATPLRRVLTTRSFWLSAALGLGLWLPNLLWQVRHGIPFRHHMQELHDTQLVHVSVANFWQDQILLCLPALWVWVPGLLALLLSRSLRPYRVVGLLYCGGLLILTLLHGKSYYALGYYPLLFAAGAVWWEQQVSRWPRAARLARPVLLVLPVLVGAPLFPILFTLYSPARMVEVGQPYRSTGVLRWEDGQDHPLPQDFADMLGWQELADKTWRAYQALPAATRRHTLILAANYGQAGAINYYNRHRPLPAAHSFNGSYLFWFPDSAARRWQHILVVDDEPDDSLNVHFREVHRAGEVQNRYAREKGTLITIGSGPDQAILHQIKQEHRQALAQWGKF